MKVMVLRFFPNFRLNYTLEEKYKELMNHGKKTYNNFYMHFHYYNYSINYIRQSNSY